MDPVLLQCFVATVDSGSITAAAVELGVSRPTLSRRLAALECALGLALLHRTTRHVQPTAVGRRLYDRVRPLFDHLAQIEAELVHERTGVTGWLRVSAPPLLTPSLACMVCELQHRHPGLSVELIGEVARADLRSDGTEVALRAGRSSDPDLIQRRLTRVRVGAVASPDYLASHGAPQSEADLEHHTLLRDLGFDGEPRSSWPLLDGSRLGVEGRFASNDQRALREATLAGAGVALLTDFGVGSDLTAGRLVRVLPERVGTELDLHVVFARRTLQPARVRAFVDAAVAWFTATRAERSRRSHGMVQPGSLRE